MNKLGLNKETLRSLNPQDAVAVGGAYCPTHLNCKTLFRCESMKPVACEPSGVVACIPPSEVNTCWNCEIM